MLNIRFIKIIPKYYKKRIIVLVSLSFLLLFLEIISLGSIIPLIDLFNPNENDSFIISWLKKNFSFISSGSLIFIIPISLLTIFVLKGLSVICIRWYENYVSHKTMNILTKVYLNNIISMDQIKLHNKKKSDFIRDLNIEIKNFCFGVLRVFLNIFSELIILIGIISFLIFIKPLYFSVIIISVFVLIVIYLLLIKKK